MDCSLPGSSTHGIFQARVLEWAAIPFCRGSSWPRDWTWVSRIVGRRFTLWATREVRGEESWNCNKNISVWPLIWLPFRELPVLLDFPPFPFWGEEENWWFSERSSEKAMAPHSSTLAWKIPWAEEPGGLQSMGSQRVGHEWATSLSLFTFMCWRRKWQPTPVFLPGESQGRGSLVGCRLWGHTESDKTEAT